MRKLTLHGGNFTTPHLTIVDQLRAYEHEAAFPDHNNSDNVTRPAPGNSAATGSGVPQILRAVNNLNWTRSPVVTQGQGASAAPTAAGAAAAALAAQGNLVGHTASAPALGTAPGAGAVAAGAASSAAAQVQQNRGRL